MITLYYESRFGLARGAVYANGQPHLYAEGLEHDPSLARLGVRSVARMKGRGGGVAFLALADGVEAVLDAPQEVMARLTEGAAVEIEIIAEARQDKLARAKFITAGEGEPRRLSPLLSLRERLRAQAQALFPDVEIKSGDNPDMIDEAEAAALEPSGSLSDGGYLNIERTRALIACDVDAAGGGAGLAHTPKSFAKACNERAAAELGRRLRLSGLAGLVVVDMIGNRHDAARLHAALRSGFAAEAQSLIIGPVGKFGTLEFVRPWGACPLMDTLADPLRAAHGLLRQAAKRAADEPGHLLTLRAPPGILDKVRPLLAGSLDPLAAIIRLQAAPKPEIVIL